MDFSRERAMAWWNELSPYYKQVVCTEHDDILVGSPRKPDSLTGREIQMVFCNKFNVGAPKKQYWEKLGVDKFIEDHGFKKGDTIIVKHSKLDPLSTVYRILDDDDRVNGQVLLSTLCKSFDEASKSNNKTFAAGENTLCVDNKWFDQNLTGRQIAICKDKRFTEL